MTNTKRALVVRLTQDGETVSKAVGIGWNRTRVHGNKHGLQMQCTNDWKMNDDNAKEVTLRSTPCERRTVMFTDINQDMRGKQDKDYLLEIVHGHARATREPDNT